MKDMFALIFLACGWTSAGQDVLTDSGALCDGELWDPAASALEVDMLAAVNASRAAGAACGGVDFEPAPPLEMSAALRCAARAHSQDMVARGYFDHDNPDGEDVAARVEGWGYDWRSVGENILQGDGFYGDADSALGAWMESSGHCSNIHLADFTELGVGVWVEGSQTTWTQVFGDR